MLKYTFKKYLDTWYNTLPFNTYKAKKETLVQRMGISESHFRKVVNYKLSDPNEARPSQLQAAAKYLDIPMEDLFNQPTTAANQG